MLLFRTEVLKMVSVTVMWQDMEGQTGGIKAKNIKWRPGIISFAIFDQKHKKAIGHIILHTKQS